MEPVSLILRQPCGCSKVIYQGEAYGIPFGRLPRLIAETIDQEKCASCKQVI